MSRPDPGVPSRVVGQFEIGGWSKTELRTRPAYDSKQIILPPSSDRPGMPTQMVRRRTLDSAQPRGKYANAIVVEENDRTVNPGALVELLIAKYPQT